MRAIFSTSVLVFVLASAASAAEMKQDADGVIVLTAPAPAPAISFEYPATRWGRYEIDVPVRDFSKAIELRVGDKKAGLGEKIYIAREGKITIAASHPDAKGLVQVIRLTPAPEGKPVAPAEDGSILLHSRDSTVHGTRLRYEAAPNKNTLGYWVNTSDWASWSFAVKKPGKFKVLVRQGCGKGQGGSEVAVELGGQKLAFVVEDTGGFQTWKDREIGTVTIEKAGEVSLAVRPVKKAKGAVMDLQQIMLVPAE